MKSLRIILGFLLIGFFAYFILFRALPRFYDEWQHAAEFAPAQHAKLVEAKCKTWNLFLFNNCTVKGETNTGEKFEIEDFRFGPAPTGSVTLLERPTNPPTFSTTVSLATLHERFYFLAFAVAASILFIIGILLYVVKALRGRSAMRPARTAGK
jgi:hypothetical protein